MNFNRSGYIGSSMSVRAAEAYDHGEKPMSHWTKDEILCVLEDEYELEYDFSKIARDTLADFFLTQTSWHHTGKFYNKTVFYSFDEDRASNFTQEDYENLLEWNEKRKETQRAERAKKKAERAAQKPRFVYVRYVEYYWTRNYHHKKDIYDYGVIEGPRFRSLYGHESKMVNGINFSVIEEFSTQEELEAHRNAAHEKEAARRKKAWEKENRKEHRKELYSLYSERYPDVSFYSFSHSKKMQAEAEELYKQRRDPAKKPTHRV